MLIVFRLILSNKFLRPIIEDLYRSLECVRASLQHVMHNSALMLYGKQSIKPVNPLHDEYLLTENSHPPDTLQPCFTIAMQIALANSFHWSLILTEDHMVLKHPLPILLWHDLISTQLKLQQES